MTKKTKHRILTHGFKKITQTKKPQDNSFLGLEQCFRSFWIVFKNNLGANKEKCSCWNFNKPFDRQSSAF